MALQYTTLADSFKTSKPLLGIETRLGGKGMEDDESFKTSKPLLGIETCHEFISPDVNLASKPLNPF